MTYATGAGVGALAFMLVGEGNALQTGALSHLLFAPEIGGLPVVPILLVVAMAVGGTLLRYTRLGRAFHVVGVRLTLAEARLPAAEGRPGGAKERVAGWLLPGCDAAHGRFPRRGEKCPTDVGGQGPG